jgi:isopentenyl-diphosphate delta-isomerase type 1
MESFIRANMNSMSITADEFHKAAWLKRLPDLLSMGFDPDQKVNGAQMAADFIFRILRNPCEILEIVDKDCAVIGAAPRNKVHGRNHWIHRVVHVLVFDRQMRLLLQKRSMSKSVAPGKWDTSVGGHVDFGESIEEAVSREMAEELGIRPMSLQFLYDYTHKNDFESEHVSTYLCHYDGQVSFNASEIDEVKFWDIREIHACLGKGIFSDNFEDEFNRYCLLMKMNCI